MKFGKKAIIFVLAAAMMAGSAVTVFAIEPSQSITQQDKQSTETSNSKKKTRKGQTSFEAERVTEDDNKEIKCHTKNITSNIVGGDGSEEVKISKRHVKNKLTENSQTSENETETSKSGFYKKIKSTTNKNTEKATNE